MRVVLIHGNVRYIGGDRYVSVTETIRETR